MRLIHDAPRSWPELCDALGPNDAADVYQFASTLGIALTADTPRDIVEDVYAAWCQSPTSAPAPRPH